MLRTAFVFLIFLGLGLTLPACAEPSQPPHRSFCAVPNYDIAPLSERPVYSVKDYGALGDGVTNDTEAIQRAFDKVPSGVILSFPKGVYLYSNVLRLTRNNIVLRGRDAVLSAQAPLRQTLELKGDRTAIIGMTLKGVGNMRDTKPDSTKIAVTGNWVQVVGNTIEGGASAGIFVYGGKDFRVVGNSVSKTLADGIHMTGAARRGVVEGNVIFNTGDDMIAVVSYGLDLANLTGNILIKNNAVSGNNWGRGITVVGGEDVVIVKNNISDVWGAAGILIAQESYYKTGPVNGILIEGNTINRIEVAPEPNGQHYSHQGAIDVNTADQSPVHFIDIKDNKIAEIGFSGIRVFGNACHISLQGNDIRNSGQASPVPPIAFTNDNCQEVSSLGCENNMANGAPFTPPQTQCAAANNDRATWPSFDFVTPQGPVWTECQ